MSYKQQMSTVPLSQVRGALTDSLGRGKEHACNPMNLSGHSEGDTDSVLLDPLGQGIQPELLQMLANSNSQLFFSLVNCPLCLANVSPGSYAHPDCCR